MLHLAERDEDTVVRRPGSIGDSIDPANQRPIYDDIPRSEPDDSDKNQELLDQIASTVSRTENLWLISMVKKDNNLTLEGASASVNGVANFITALKRSGYFDKIEIQEAKEDDVVKSVTTYGFTMTASVAQTPTTQTPSSTLVPSCPK